MRLLGDIQKDVQAIRDLLEEEDGEGEEEAPEDDAGGACAARGDAAPVRERIAYHEAKAREEEERRATERR